MCIFRWRCTSIAQSCQASLAALVVIAQVIILIYGMSNARLEELLRQKRQLDNQLVGVRKKRQAAEMAVRKKSREWSVGGHDLDVVLAIYALSDCVAEPAVAYLQSVARMYHWPEVSTPDLIKRIETLFITTDLTRLALEGRFLRR